MSLTIVDVRLHELIVPMRPETVHSSGVDDKLCAPDPVSGRSMNFWEFSKWIIEIVADNGLVGYGEPRRGDLEKPLREYAELLIGKKLVHLPPGDVPLPRGDDYESYIIYEAFEMAWYDLLGKYLEVPVWYLLGGKKIDRVPIDYWMGRCTPEESFARTQKARSLGFHGVKMKCTAGDPLAERVAAVREAAPEFSVVLDANERFETVEATVAVSESLEEFDDIILESPVPQQRIDWYVRLRSEIRHPVALHLTAFSQLHEALQADAAHYYNLLGPLSEFTLWARYAQDLGYPVWRGTGMDLGVRDMSSVHAAAAAGCGLPSDIIGHLFREDDFLLEPIGLRDGCLTVPDKPGLGIELDYDAIEKYRVS